MSQTEQTTEGKQDSYRISKTHIGREKLIPKRETSKQPHFKDF